jgi:glycerophosphoryl diester phosphodiesterase
VIFLLIAHRGVHNSFIDENKMSAFVKTINNDLYSGFELDIRQSLDNKICVIHDFFIKNNLVSKTNYDKLKEYDIPLLEDVLKLNTDKIILIEIKDNLINLDNLVKLLNKYKDKNIYVMSFNNDIIKRINNMEHKFKCGILNYIFNKELSYNEYDFICLLDNIITDDLIEYFKLKKIEVFSYGIISKKDYYNEEIKYIIDNNLV